MPGLRGSCCTLVLVLLAAASGISAQASLVGKWALKFATVAEQPTCCSEVILDLKVDAAGKVTGLITMGDWPGEAPISAGTLKGDHVSLTAIGRLESSSGYPRIGVDGTIQGDKIKVTLSMGPAGSDTIWHKWEMTGQRLPK